MTVDQLKTDIAAALAVANTLQQLHPTTLDADVIKALTTIQNDPTLLAFLAAVLPDGSQLVAFVLSLLGKL